MLLIIHFGKKLSYSITLDYKISITIMKMTMVNTIFIKWVLLNLPSKSCTLLLYLLYCSHNTQIKISLVFTNGEVETQRVWVNKV